MEPTYQLNDLIGDCATGVSKAYVSRCALAKAKLCFNLNTQGGLLGFLGNGGLEKPRLINTKPWKNNPNSNHQIMVDAYHFRSGSIYGYIAFFYQPITGRWIIKSFKKNQIARYEKIRIKRISDKIPQIVMEGYMNEKIMTCPVCGSNQVNRSEKTSGGSLALGANFSFKKINCKCTACGERGDFLAETDKNYLAAQEEAQNNLVNKLIKRMNNTNITMPMFERVFELPPRTLTRWKNGDFSATALALLRIVTVYPWIIEVAENKFDRTYRKCAVIKAAAQVLQTYSGNWGDLCSMAPGIESE